jgi:transposase
MKHTPGLQSIILVLLLIVTLLFLVCSGQPPMMWDEHLVPPIRVRQAFNGRKNRQRWLRRWARRQRQRSQVRRPRRRRPRRPELCQRLRSVPPCAGFPSHPWPTTARGAAQQMVPSGTSRRRKKASRPKSKTDGGADPLVELRQRRGLVDLVPQRELWAMLLKIRWPQGAVCPRCGERDPRYVCLLDADYRQGLGRWHCRLCAEAGDPGQGGTFTPLTGTLLQGMRFDVRSLWFMAEMFADGKASVETSEEARVNRQTSDRLFRLFRAAIYQSRSMEPIALGPDDVAEFDEVYLTAGLKGGAGGLTLEREARQRGLKRRGRGDWDSDRLPVFGLLCRGGQVRLFVLRNVQTDTIRPIVQQMVKRGARVYTDSYCIYHFLSEAGYQHQTVNHSAGEYALDLDGDGQCEVHCNTMECTWSWLRQMVRTYRGVSKVYLPLYVTQFEFLYNRRHLNRWNRTLDVLQAVFQVDAGSAADLRDRVQTARLAEVCPVAG